MHDTCQCEECKLERQREYEASYPEQARRDKLELGAEATTEFAREEALLLKTGMTERDARARGLID